MPVYTLTGTMDTDKGEVRVRRKEPSKPLHAPFGLFFPDVLVSLLTAHPLSGTALRVLAVLMASVKAGDAVPLGRKAVAERLPHLPSATLDDALRALVEGEYVIRVKRDTYRINPLLFWRGSVRDLADAITVPDIAMCLPTAGSDVPTTAC